MKGIRKSAALLFLVAVPALSLIAQDVIITSITSTPVTCGEGSDGTITVTVTGGVSGNYNYLLIRNSIPVESVGPISSNTYTFNGHTKYTSYVISVSDEGPGSGTTGDGFGFASISGPEPIQVNSFNSTDITCNGVSDGTITVTAQGEGGNFVFDLAGPVNQSNPSGFFANLSGGDYTVTVSDADGCPSTDVTPVLTINDPLPVSATLDGIIDVECNGDNTGAINITPSGGTPGGSGSGYTYSWTGPGSFTASSEDLVNVAAGNYSVTVFDNNGCSTTLGPLTVSQPPEIVAVVNSSTDVTCNGGNDGTAGITVSGGVGGYSFSWDGQFNGLVSTDEDPVNLPADSYDLTVFDANGCEVNYPSLVVIEEPDPFLVDVDGTTDVSCTGGNDGNARITPDGGTPPYTYIWSGSVSGYSSSDQDPVDMPADVYSLTLIDSRGCSQLFTDLLSIGEPAPVSLTLTGSSDVSCFGGSDGGAQVNVNGGTPPYLFQWIGDATLHTSGLEDPDDLVADTYDLTVTDNNGCALNFNDIITIGEPDQLDVTVDNITDVNCNQGSTGAVEITPLGGTPPYTFDWSGPNGFTATTEDISNLEAGNYSLTMTDLNECTWNFVDVATVNESTSIISTFNLSQVSCNGGADGEINATVAGGSPPYIYSWSGPGGFTAGTEDLFGAEAGTYQLTVTDALECVQAFPPQTLTEPTAISTSASPVDIDCFGAGNGSVDLTVSGGTPPYSFAWSGPGGFTSASEDISGLEAGSYSVTVSDANLCTILYTDIATVDEPAEVQLTSSQTDITCAGDDNGTIEITVTGGVLPYIFNWTGPGGFNSNVEDLSGLKAGTYNLTLTDDNGCVLDLPGIETIIEPAAINASLISKVDILCAGESTGTIDVEVTGGTPPYSYSWTGPSGFTASSEDVSNLVAGSYQLTVTDDAGCTYEMAAVNVNEPAPITATATSIDIDCFGAGNGSIDLSVSGGVLPFGFDWSGPGGFTSSNEDISGLEAGDYSVEITDANLCILTIPDIATVDEPAELQATSVKTDISCAGDNDGTISVTVSGGTTPYSYSWTGPGGFTSADEDISSLPAGTYNLTVTDVNGCVLDIPGIETIAEGSAVIVSVVSEVDILCNGAATGSADIDVTGGSAPYTFLWTGPGGFTSSTEDLSNVLAGTYSLEVNDLNGCTASYSGLVTLTEPDLLESNISGTDILCYGDNNGTIEITTTGGTSPYEYSRVGNIDAGYQPGNQFNSLGPGFYTIWTRDANLCVVTDTITITEPDEIQVLGETKSGQNLCFGDSSAQISIDVVTGGVEPYEYSINGGADFSADPLFPNLPAGSYQTVIRDARGCTASGNLNVITQPTALRKTFYFQENITSCSYAPDGRITINGAGGKGTITYLLDETIPSPAGDFQNVTAGPHQVQMEDENGCTWDTTVMILAPPPLEVQNLVITGVTGCTGNSNGSLAVTGSGGTGTIVYALDGGAFQPGGIFNGVQTGNHTLTLKDGNDCTLDTVVFVNEPLPLTILTETAVPITCAGASDGEVVVTAVGGTAPLTYTLEPGTIINTSGTFTGLGPGNYTVTVDDAEGCGPFTSELLTLTDPPALLLDTVEYTEISCFGSSDGSIMIRALGGIPPYEYSINGQTNWSVDSLFTGLGPGIYELYVRDANLCILSAGQVELTEPAQITLSVSTTDITPCAGDTNGIIEGSAGGGTGPLQYSLDSLTFGDSGLFTDLTAGEYTLYVKDSTGCTIAEPVVLSQPDSVKASVFKVDATLGNPGAIGISGATGGTPPYQFSIHGDTGLFSSDTVYADLEPGPYEVVVRDANGCAYRESLEILDVLPLNVEVNITHVSCFGENDGSIEMIPQDAVGAVGYSIDSGQNFVLNPLFGNLPGDSTYYLVALDAMGKLFFDSVTIQEPDSLEINAQVSLAQCNRFSETGSIELNVTGGTGAYSYRWSDDSISEDRRSLAAGIYEVEVTDENNCSVSEILEVTSEVSVVADAGTDTTICPGDTIQLQGQGGFTATWDSSPFLDRTGIPDPYTKPVTENTTFVLTITEDQSGYGCYDRDSVTVSLFPLVGISTIPDTLILSGGSVELLTTGGPFLQYLWEPATGLDDPTAPNPVSTPPATIRYYVYAQNEYGCEESDSVLIEVVEDIEVYNVFSPNGDGINDYFEIENAERFPEMVVEVYSRWGDMLFQSKGYEDGNRWDGTARGKDAPVGTYYYVIIPYSGADPITGNVTIIR